MSNPFFYGNPVPPDKFLNRKKALRFVVSRITNNGQSTAIIGEPRMGKTSLLEYLAAPENSEALYGAAADRIIFCLMDAHMLGGFSQEQFWEQALAPLVDRVITPEPDTPLAEHYRISQQNHFGAFTLERLLAQLHRENWRLVLLLDEFDAMLQHPVLNSAEFFGSLRALASRSRGALVVVTASRQSLTALHAETYAFNPTGSPYFNFFAQVVLGELPNKDVVALLGQAGNRLSTEDRRYINAVAGGHPYLLQLAASAIWEEIDAGANDPYERYFSAGQRIYQETKFHFSETWRVWLPAMRKAVAAVALAQTPYLLEGHKFLSQAFIKDLPDFTPEINDLRGMGIVAEDDNIPGGYRLTQGAMLWQLADELTRIVRDDQTFESWLQDQHLVGVLTEKELAYLSKAAQFTGGLLKQGAATLVEAFAKGMVSS